MTTQKTLDKSHFIDRKKAAAYLGITYATLTNLHKKQEGPKFYRIGGLSRYKVADLDAFIEANAVKG